MRKWSQAVMSFDERARRRGGFGPVDLGRDRRREAGGEFVLHGEQVADVAVEPAGPQLFAGLGRDQLGGDADLVGGASHRALDQVARVDLARDQARAHIPALVGEGRIAAQHPIERLQRKRVDQVLGQPVGKILLRAFAEVRKRQHADDRRAILGRKIGGRRLARGLRLRGGWRRCRRAARSRPGSLPRYS